MNPLFSSSGRVLTVPIALAVAPFTRQNGLTFDATGKLIVDAVAPIANFSNGLPMTSTGALAVTAA